MYAHKCSAFLAAAAASMMMAARAMPTRINSDEPSNLGPAAAIAWRMLKDDVLSQPTWHLTSTYDKKSEAESTDYNPDGSLYVVKARVAHHNPLHPNAVIVDKEVRCPLYAPFTPAGGRGISGVAQTLTFEKSHVKEEHFWISMSVENTSTETDDDEVEIDYSAFEGGRTYADALESPQSLFGELEKIVAIDYRSATLGDGETNDIESNEGEFNNGEFNDNESNDEESNDPPVMTLSQSPQTPHLVMLLYAAILQGNKEAVGAFYRAGLPMPEELGEIAALHGHVNLIEWASENNQLDKSAKVCAAAALHNHLIVIEKARELGCAMDASTAAAAARGNYLPLLEKLKNKYGDFKMDAYTCMRAAENGNLEMLQWARRHGCEWNSLTAASASQRGHWNLLKWALEEGCPGQSSCASDAARVGDRELLDLLRPHWDSDTFVAAVENGDTELLQYLLANGCPMTRDAFSEAAGRGNVKVLERLLEKGCERSAYACTATARNGHLAVLVWLREHNVPWTSDVIKYSKKKYPHIAKWARSNGCPEEDEPQIDHIDQRADGDEVRSG